VNLDVPGAVTVVSFDDFVRGADWRHARKADRNMLASVNPVLDPLLLTPLRNAVVNSAWGRGKKDIPPGIAKKLNDTTVITSTAPVAPPFRRDVAKSMRVDTVSDRAKGQKFKVRDERQGKGVAQQPAQAPAQVQQQPAEQKPRAQAQRDLRRAEQEQRKQQREQPKVDRSPRAAQAERAARPAQQQAQGERVAAPQRQQQRQVVPQQRQQPQMRKDPGPVKNAQPAPRPAAAPVRAQPQQQQKHERPAQAQQKQERAAPKAPPSKGGGGGKGKKP
jgi:hypothetical protein